MAEKCVTCGKLTPKVCPLCHYQAIEQTKGSPMLAELTPEEARAVIRAICEKDALQCPPEFTHCFKKGIGHKFCQRLRQRAKGEKK